MTTLFSHSSIQVNVEKAKLLRGQAAQALQKNELVKAHRLLALAKSLRTPLESIDYLRALTFFKIGNPSAACEALKEELRYFPDNSAARSLLNEMKPQGIACGNEEFQKICSIIAPFTMVGPLRLHALYEHAVKVCQSGPQGNFVECGVAAGGTSALLSAIIKTYDISKSRRLFALDSFSGMPKSTVEDVCNDGQSANETGWGDGTCAAPESSVLNLCEQLGTRDLVTTIKGFFEETLPLHTESFGPIAFLHMEGDWYSSTKAILENLYDRLVPGAYVQVDDYGYWKGCRKAVTEFFKQRGISFTCHTIDATGVWFTKT